MPASYELWLTDDSGNRLAPFTDFGEPYYFSYTRAVDGIGTINLGLPFEPFADKFNPYFKVDWRVEVWRATQYGSSLRLEDIYMLRKPHVYTRQDGIRIIQFYGNNGYDLLTRRYVVQRAGTSWASKTDYADDMMKEIVSEQMLYGSALDEDGVSDNTRAFPQYEFSVESDYSLGPSIPLNFNGKQVSTVLKDIKSQTFQLNVSSSSNHRIFFSVDPVLIANTNTPARSGYIFRTHADLFGVDRTQGVEFSEENENIKRPSYAESHLDEVNSVFVNGNGNGNSQLIENVEDTDRVNASRWNRCEKVISASSQTTASALQNAGYAELDKGKPKLELPVIFQNTAGSKNTPRSLYGIDWDIGDLLRVSYAGRQFNVECTIIYVSVDENGQENITGRNEVPQ